MPDIPCFLQKDQLLTDKEIINLAKLLVGEFGIKKIRLTGGEPLVRKNAAEIIESLSKLPVELALTTNGITLDKFLPLFQKIGLKSLNISLDSLMPNMFHEITKQDLFYTVFRNINLAIADGFHVKINTVLKRGMNDHEINDFINWTQNTPIHVRFIEFMPFDGNKWHWDKVITYKEIQDTIKNRYTVERLNDSYNSTAKRFKVKGFKGTYAVISSVSKPFCQSCNRIRLTADGKLKNCLFSNDEIDILSHYRNKEDIRPLILDCIKQKKLERGGLVAFNNEEANIQYEQGRCMTTIGG